MEYSKDLIAMLQEKARQLRRDVVRSVGVGVAGHIGGSNSAADLVAALYFYKMKYDPTLIIAHTIKGRVDVLINNAGINIRKPIEEMCYDE